MREQIREIIKVDGNHKWSSSFDVFITSVVFLAIIHLTLETEKDLFEAHHAVFHFIEILFTIIFSIEYLMRLVAFNRKEDGSFLSYIFSFAMLIDLLALIPFYLTLTPIDLRYLRIFRLFRFARIFKLSRYNKAIHSISIVINNKKELLTIVFVLILFLLYIVSALMYFVENPAQPEAFSSILSTMWWGVATLTTVGYGDIYPITGLGKILGGIIAILGIGLFAIPTGIIASGFLEYFKENKWEE